MRYSFKLSFMNPLHVVFLSRQLYLTLKRNYTSSKDRTYIKHKRLFSSSHLLFFCPFLLRWDAAYFAHFWRRLFLLCHTCQGDKGELKQKLSLICSRFRFMQPIYCLTLLLFLSTATPLRPTSSSEPDPRSTALTPATLSLPEYPAIYECQKHWGRLFMKHS